MHRLLKISKVSIKNKHPFLRIDDLFDKLHMDTHFCKVDLRFGYHQLWVWESDIPKMSFQTRYGRFEFLVMSFGLINVLAIFMDLMNKMLNTYLYMLIVVFIYDILIYSRSEKDHMNT